MRTVTYGGACSLDGYLAGKDGNLDWLHFSKDVQQVMADYWKTIDTILMGRKTWSISAGQEGQDGQERDKAERPAKSKTKSSGRKKKEPAMRTYVFSRTLKQITAPGVTLVTGDAAEFVRNLKQQPGRGICLMGGGEFARSMFAVDLVDEIGLNVHPILLGAGVPAFLNHGRTINLALTESRVIDGGCVLMNYRIKR